MRIAYALLAIVCACAHPPAVCAIRAYAGDDIRATRHLPRDAEYLIDPEPTVINYDLSVLDVGCAR